MLASWLGSLRRGEACIDFECLMKTSLATIMAVESLSIAMPLEVDLSVLEHYE